MKPTRPDWTRLVLALVVYLLAMPAFLLVMSIGDCGPGVANCGETRRLLSLVVLILGTAWLIYVVARFVSIYTKH